MRLIIVRHGETIENAAKIVQGQAEGMLNDMGKKQAKRLCDRLLKEPIDVIYCSDLKRCKDTIAPYLKQRKIPVHYTKALREVAHGIFEGKPRDELIAWRKLHEKEKFTIRPPHGESFYDAQHRATTFLSEIYRSEAGKNVLLVTHGGIKLGLILHLLGKGVDEHAPYKAPNTAVTIFNISDDKKHHAECINCVKHLD